MYEDVYVPLDLNNPVEAALFRQLGSVVTDDRSRQKEWGAHCWRVALLTTLVAIEHGRPTSQAIDYGIAAYLHDWGKFDPEIAHLFKLQRKFTPEERMLADRHGYLGAQMARNIYGESYDPRKLRLIISGHLTHHINFSGGWLNAMAASLLYNEHAERYLAGKSIPRIGRIIHVVDSFDTIVHRRPYKDAQTVSYACSELRKCAGTCYDPEIVEALILKVLPTFVERRKILGSGSENRV